ncbi:unnamed protein product, partial [Ectocarpus sp. 12 AP-2014]
MPSLQPPDPVGPYRLDYCSSPTSEKHLTPRLPDEMEKKAFLSMPPTTPTGRRSVMRTGRINFHSFRHAANQGGGRSDIPTHADGINFV